MAAISALANAGWALGIAAEPPSSPVGPLLLSALMVAIAVGMWRARYWAVLGLQALLAITLLYVSLFVLLNASLVEAIGLFAAVLLPAGVLFWFLVKAMARIQMPARR